MTDQPINLTELRDNPWIVTGTEDARPEDHRRASSEEILVALIDAAEAAHAVVNAHLGDMHAHSTIGDLEEVLERFTWTQP